MHILLQPIGVIHSPFNQLEMMPIQPAGKLASHGTIVIDPQYGDGLKDLDGFSHIFVIYHFHKSATWKLRVQPFMDDEEERGIFATRAPNRPNPIGLSVMRIQNIEKNIIHVNNVDVLDGTPLLDIKPYVPQFDRVESIRIGWLTGRVNQVSSKLSDDRFKEN